MIPGSFGAQLLSMPRHTSMRACLAIAVGAVIVAAPMASEGAELGRLFFAPQERAELDRLRREPPKPKPKPLPEQPVVVRVEPPEPKPDPKPVSISGHVARSTGRSTTWVNGVPRNDSFRLDERSATVSVRIEETGARVPIKVGQTFEPASGRFQDGLMGGRIGVRRP